MPIGGSAENIPHIESIVSHGQDNNTESSDYRCNINKEGIFTSPKF